MSLYDDFDTRERAEKVAGWSSGIKLLQSQLQLKKATTTQPRRDNIRKASKVLAPVIDLNLKSRKNEDEDIYPTTPENKPKLLPVICQQPQVPITPITCQLNIEYDIEILDEYNPLFPNEYEKVIKEMREVRERENDHRYEERERDRERRKSHRQRGKSRFEEPEEPPTPRSGFCSRRDVEEESPPHREVARGGGAAIAPPPSLLEPDTSSPGSSSMIDKQNFNVPYGTSSVAAKIMAKYGFKEGQGLGKQQQGMSMALQVEKTSKRGGRIIHEKEIALPLPLTPLVVEYDSSPPPTGPPSPIAMPPPAAFKVEPTITEIMKSPSKVVLLRNMVGPGDVDSDLEPEVKDECNTKYGDVIKVLIHELPGAQPEDAVRIFVEFKRIESAIKAVVDLNGRFFGGRQVRAGFYSCLSFSNLSLLE